MTQEEIQQKAYEVYPLDLDRHFIIEGEPYDNNKEKREAYIKGLKAGAEWMAEQFECVGSYAIPDERGGYWPSDTYYIKKK